MRNRLIFAFLLIILFFVSGCFRHGRHSHISFGFIFAPISFSSSSERIYTHDDHIHDEFCGHPRKWYDGRWVYYYNGRWEFYDYNEKVYYYIPSELIENADE